MCKQAALVPVIFEPPCIILLAVFYFGVRLGSVAPREEHRLKVFEADIRA